MVKPSLLQLHPHLEVSVKCLQCHSVSVKIHDYLFEGIHVLADCTCQSCTTKFFHTLPIAHDATTPITVSHDGLHTQYDPSAKVWLALPLIDALFNKSNRITCEIEKKNLKPLNSTVILLNCLDDCFGHAFVKMLNAQKLLEAYPEYSLILLITTNFEWLVPDGVSELWIVSGSMPDMKKYVTDLQSFVKNQLNEISQCYLSTAKVFHDFKEINSALFLKTKRFDLSQFDRVPYTVTFVLREDRYWHANRFDEFVNRVFIKFKIQKYFRSYFLWQQNRLVRRAMGLMLSANPNLQVIIAGIGKSGRFPKAVSDLRTKKVTAEIEKQWCDTYAKSHIVIGVHGSNMLIPTSLAAGFIGILPRHKIPHLGEDTVLHYSSRYAILLGRHLDEYATPTLIAQHATSMLKFGEVARLMEEG